MLRQGGFFPVSISPVGGAEGRVTKVRIKVKPLAGFCSQMSAMLRAGVPIAKTLEILKNQTENKPLRLILESVFTAIQRGNSLSEALQPYEENFPAIFMNMIEAGEASGTLDDCLQRAGDSFTRSAKLNGKVRNSMIYPIIILVVLIGLLVLMLVFVVPAFSGMYADAGGELPAFTQALLGLSGFLQSYWYIVLLIAVGLVASFRIWLKTDAGRTAFDRLKFKMPVVNRLLNKIYAARFARTLSSLTATGVSLPNALNVTARSVVNRVMEKALYGVVDSINRGEELSACLERMDLLPDMIVYLTRLGEESGTLDTLLSQAADFFDDESDSALTAMMAMLEPMLILIMAAVVIPILLGVVQPMFGMFEMLM